MRAYSSHQFGDVFSGFTSRFGDGSGMQVRVRLADGSTGMVMVFASVVDNATNDGYLVRGSMSKLLLRIKAASRRSVTSDRSLALTEASSTSSDEVW